MICAFCTMTSQNVCSETENQSFRLHVILPNLNISEQPLPLVSTHWVYVVIKTKSHLKEISHCIASITRSSYQSDDLMYIVGLPVNWQKAEQKANMNTWCSVRNTHHISTLSQKLCLNVAFVQTYKTLR